MNSPRYEVVWPLGRRHVHSSANLDLRRDLENREDKTIAFLWDYAFFGDRMFDIIRSAMQDQAPGTRFVDPDEFGNVQAVEFVEHGGIEDLPNRLRSKGVTGVVVAVGA
jgi:hypothetical protein